MDDFWQTCLGHLQKDGCAPSAAAVRWADVLTSRSWDSERGVLTLIAPNEESAAAAKMHQAEIQSAALSAGASLQALEVVVDPVERCSPDEHRLFAHLRFDNYICGHANQLAVAAAEHVALTTGSQYNPLYICGATGVGKTHLMHAVGCRFLETHPKAKVKAANSAWLAVALGEAANKGERALERFQANWLSLDLLLIDDIHRLASIKASEQTIRLIETIALSAQQLVLTSNFPIDALKPICPRLHARVLKGMAVGIGAPEFDMRTAILLAHAQDAGIELPEEAAVFIAKRFTASGRELEGALAQIAMHQQLAGKRGVVTLEAAKQVLQDLRLQSESPITIDNIRQTVADYYGLDASALINGARTQKLVLARRAALYLAKQLTQLSYPEIGKQFGGRGPAAVTAAVEQIERARRESSAADRDIRILEQMIRG